MTTNKLIIPILIPGRKIELTLYGTNSTESIIEKEDAMENGEAPIQIKEGHFYEYKIDDGYYLQPSEIVTIHQSNERRSSGRISPNIYVGTVSIDILKLDTEQKCTELRLEVQSEKTRYREDYRNMLEEITEQCTDLLLQHSSPVSQFFEVDYNADSNILYQRFAFVKSLLDSVEFNDAINKVLTSAVTRWRDNETIKDIRGIKRFGNSVIRQISNASNRLDLPDSHPLKRTLNSIPAKLKVNYKTETVDTPENRFVKHALISFQSLCSDFKNKVKTNERIRNEAGLLENRLGQYLDHSIFKEITSPTTVPLNSPILQRKEGYREILRAWLMFELAAKIVWGGGDDVYSGNKRDVAVLYEYWLFFKLLGIIKDVFKVEPKKLEHLLRKTENGLEIQLRQGRHFPIEGIYDQGKRKLNIQFSYNRPFSGGKDYPVAGSWTKDMRPDYTLTIWPVGLSQSQAEKEELIVHIHFDAKYKIDKATDIFGPIEGKIQSEDELQQELTNEKNEQSRGTFKREDLLKMHSYKDAIRRTAGAYVLYPGNEDNYLRKGFHELIPGLGAFSIRPSKENSGIAELENFLIQVVHHFMNRASQREKIALKTYETYKNPKSNELEDLLPESHGSNRNFSPDETSVLIGYYKKENLEWILARKLFNTRAGNRRGSLKIGPGEVGAKYLLLHTSGEFITRRLFKIKDIGPKIFSRKTLERLGYPEDEEKQNDYYIVYKIETIIEPEFKGLKWDVRKLKGYKMNRGSALPFSVSFIDLMVAIENS